MNATAFLAAAALSLAACATATPPNELVSARTAVARAEIGRAGALAPLDVDAARGTLHDAESAFSDGKVEVARDLAYVAERKAQLAEARADETAALTEKN